VRSTPRPRRFTIDEAREAGYSTQEELVYAGFAKDFKEWLDQLSCIDAKELGLYSCAEARAAGYLVGLSAAGYSCAEALEAGYPVTDLIAAGYTCADARAGGTTCEEVKAAGYSLAEAKEAGYPLPELRAVGYSCADAKDAGYTCAEAEAAGFSLTECRRAGFTGKEVSTQRRASVDRRAAKTGPGDGEGGRAPPGRRASFSVTIPAGVNPGRAHRIERIALRSASLIVVLFSRSGSAGSSSRRCSTARSRR